MSSYMLRNSFYEYGKVTNWLTYAIFPILLFMYISKGLNEVMTTNLWESCYRALNLFLLVILIFKFSWYLINRKTLTISTSRVGAIFFKLNTFLLDLILVIFSITTIFIFILNAYTQFEMNVENEVSYRFFGVTVVPFSIIRLIGDICTTYSSIDILNVKFCLSKLNTLIFALLLPLLSGAYLIQLYFYKKIRKERLPEGF